MSDLTHTLPENMILAEGLVKTFGEVIAVDHLTFTIEAGEIFGLLGPNGAGKTTTIRMLGALIAPTAGHAQVAGFNIGSQDRDIRRCVGFLPESPGLYHALSAERNLAFYARLYEVEDVPSKVEQYLRMLNLWERRHQPVSTFSKGMRQKLAIARALLHEPRVLLLDEPTSGLDPEMARLVREFISSLKREGRAIVICTHNLDEADRLCDRIAVLKTRLLALDTPAALRRKLYGRSVVFHLKNLEPNYIQVLKTLNFVISVQTMDNKVLVTLDNPEEQNPVLVRTLVEIGAEIQFIGELRRTLEDVYLQLVKADKEEIQS
ncbi:MAG: ABC transporter ATP-binding protein [Chloroflexota bacterium]